MKKGKLDEGNCYLKVQLDKLPEEFHMLGSNIQEQLTFHITLENITTEKSYCFELNQNNQFKQTASLNPGIYRVLSCYVSPLALTNMEIKAGEHQVELRADKEAVLPVLIQNQEEFADWVWGMQPVREIAQLDKFSRKVQWDGQVIELARIIDYVEFNYDHSVQPYKKITLNSDEGVEVTLQNQTDKELSWRECSVIKVTFYKDNVIFGKGVRNGMAVSEVMHKEKGLYGIPDSMSGTVLMGMDYAETRAIYQDAISGDKLTIKIPPSGDFISGFIYEFAVFQ